MNVNKFPDGEGKNEKLPDGFTLKSLLIDSKGKFHRIAGVDEEGVDVQDMNTGDINPHTFEAFGRLFVIYVPIQDPEYVNLIRTAGWLQAKDSREIFTIASDVNPDGAVLISQRDGKKTQRIPHEEIVCNYEFCHDLNDLPVPRYTIETLQKDVLARLKDSGLVVIKDPTN